MTSVFRISLDIHQTQSQVSIPASMGADNVRLIIRLTEKGNPFEIEDGSYAFFSAVKPDGKPLYNDCAIASLKEKSQPREPSRSPPASGRTPSHNSRMPSSLCLPMVWRHS